MAMKLTPAKIAAMSDTDRSKAATVERADARRAKDAGKRKPPTPVNDWINAHPEASKSTGRKAGAARVGAGPRLPEAERVKLFNDAVKAGANTMAGVKKHIRSRGKPCSGKWIRPLLAEAAKKGLLKESAPRKAPAKRTAAAKKAPAKKATTAKKATARKRATPSELSKAHQTRGRGKKATATAARRTATRATRVTKRTPARRRAA
jgi:hypothetical protein